MRPEPVEGPSTKLRPQPLGWYEASIRGLLTLGSTTAHRALIADQPALRGD
jgi:hypothetical protein